MNTAARVFTQGNLVNPLESYIIAPLVFVLKIKKKNSIRDLYLLTIKMRQQRKQTLLNRATLNLVFECTILKKP